MSECIEHSQKGSRTRTGQPQGYGSTSYKGQGSVALSRELGVCQSTIYKAVCGETWKHL